MHQAVYSWLEGSCIRMKTLVNYLTLPTLLIFFFITFFLISVPYYSGDVKNHVVWGRSILNEGAPGFYGREFHGYSFPNYPPVSMFSFAASAWFYDFSKSLIFNLNNYSIFPSGLVHWIEYENVLISFLKIPAILPFVLSGWFVYLFARLFKKNVKQSLLYTILFLLNPSLIYLAVVWGQNDFTQVLFILGAFYFFLREKFIPAYIFAGLSILSKQTVLMIWGVFFVTFFKLYGISKSAVVLLTSITILWLAYLPFNVSSPIWPFTFYNETLKTTGFLVSDNAINFWGLIFNFKPVDAAQNLFLLRWEHWGFLAFGLLSFPLLYKYLKTKFSSESLFYFLFMISITYFFILTRMHERYLFFGIIFAHFLTMVNRKYWYNLLFFSVLYFLNLYRGLFQPDFPLLPDLLRNEIFLSGLAAGYLVILIYNYYFYMFKSKNEAH